MRWDLRNEKDIEGIQERIKFSCRKMGRPDICEEAAQEVYARLLEGKHKHATIDQAVIDYLRTVSGRKGVPSYASRQAFEHSYSYEPRHDANSIVRSFGINMDDRLDVRRLIGMVRHWERAIMNLYFVEGYGQAEIGNFFGVSESRVSQWLERIQKRISNRVGSEESRLRGQAKEGLETILSEKANGNRWRVEQGQIEGLARCKSWAMEILDEASF